MNIDDYLEIHIKWERVIWISNSLYYRFCCVTPYSPELMLPNDIYVIKPLNREICPDDLKEDSSNYLGLNIYEARKNLIEKIIKNKHVSEPFKKKAKEILEFLEKGNL